MTSIDPDVARDFLEATVVAFSILGGVMAYSSGSAAASALARGDRPEILAQQVNVGIGLGFIWGAPSAFIALVIMTWA